LKKVHGVNAVRQAETHTAKLSGPAPSPSKLKMAIEKLKRYKPGSDQILAEVIQAGGNILHSEIHKLISSIWNKEEIPQMWEVPVTVPIIKRVIKLNVVTIERYYYYQLHTKFYQIFLSVRPVLM
jgi:hypothetical protein